MGAIEADENPARMRFLRQRSKVKQLSAGVEHRRQDGQLDVRGQRCKNVIVPQRAAVAALDQPQVAGGIEAALPQVALQRVEIGGEVQLVGDDNVSPSGGGAVSLAGGLGDW